MDTESTSFGECNGDCLPEDLMLKSSALEGYEFGLGGMNLK